MRLAILSGLMTAFLAAPLTAYVGRWHSWPNLHPAKAMVEYQGRLYVGTTGGVRSIDPAGGAEKDFDNLSGITDIRIVAMTIDADNRLWAASRSGMLFRMEGNTWSAWGRAYRAEGWN